MLTEFNIENINSKKVRLLIAFQLIFPEFNASVLWF